MLVLGIGLPQLQFRRGDGHHVSSVWELATATNGTHAKSRKTQLSWRLFRSGLSLS